MKNALTTILGICILLPGFIFADDFAEYMNQVIERAQDGEEVVVESHSSVSTGGQVAGAGQSVTDGDVSASSHVETHINTGNNGGTVQVKIETSKNGEKKTEEYTKDIKAGEPVEVNAAAKVDSEGMKIETKVDGEVVIDTEEGTESESDDDLKVAIESRIEKAFKAVPNFFKKVFSFFWGW